MLKIVGGFGLFRVLVFLCVYVFCLSPFKPVFVNSVVYLVDILKLFQCSRCHSQMINCAVPIHVCVSVCVRACVYELGEWRMFLLCIVLKTNQPLYTSGNNTLCSFYML